MMIPLFAEFAIPNGAVLFWLALIFGLYMAWNIGANDVANAMGTSVGSGALTLKQAVLIAAIMELAGAVLVGMHVTDTVRKGIFDPSQFPPELLVLGFLSALLAAALWLQIASLFGLPVSTTHSIVGAVVGVGMAIGGGEVINWSKVFEIILSWVSSPLCGAFVSYLLFLIIQRQILDRENPLQAAYKITPFLVFYVGFVLAMVMVFKGLKNLKLDLDLPAAILTSTAVGAIFYLVAILFLKRLRRKNDLARNALINNLQSPQSQKPDSTNQIDQYDHSEISQIEIDHSHHSDQIDRFDLWESIRRFEFEKVESIFGFLMILSACFLAFAHGANDVANAIGPVAAVVDIVRSGEIAKTSQVPIWILLMGGIGIVIGLATWGYRVIETVGKKITKLTPSRGFAANLGAATTIVLASRLGFPISTTHTLIGAVLGIGFARGMSSLNFRIIRDIVASWLITIPAGAGLAVAFYHLLRMIFA